MEFVIYDQAAKRDIFLKFFKDGVQFANKLHASNPEDILFIVDFRELKTISDAIEPLWMALNNTGLYA